MRTITEEQKYTVNGAILNDGRRGGVDSYISGEGFDPLGSITAP